jgi:acylphosphatase
MPEKVRAHVWITGRVQGVFFRQQTARAARGAGVAGWVRNLPDGRVEAAFEGEGTAVESLVSWMNQGPPMAHVEMVETEWEDPAGDTVFRII